MQPKYPYEEGDTIVLGPEVFASQDKDVICWRGENYYTPSGLYRKKLAARLDEIEHELESHVDRFPGVGLSLQSLRRIREKRGI